MCILFEHYFQWEENAARMIKVCLMRIVATLCD